MLRSLAPDRCKAPLALWRATEAIGIPASALLRHAHLPTTLHLTGQTISTAQYFALMRSLETLAERPALGLQLIRDSETSVHPPSNLAAFHARDYREGLERLARYKRLFTPETLNLTLEKGGCAVTVDWLHATEPEPAVSIDITFATVMELGRRQTGHPVRPVIVEFARSDPRTPEYEAYFQAPVRFGAERDRLVLDAGDLDRPFLAHNPELLALLTPALSQALETLDAKATIADQVTSALKQLLPNGRPDVSDVARDLAMSERTLQRRILAEGTTYRALLLRARQDMWKRLLADDALQVDEIAFLLGYQDVTSFYRAFRAWEGVTPAVWREQHALGGGNAVVASDRTHRQSDMTSRPEELFEDPQT